MKHNYSHFIDIISFVLTIIIMASCGGYAKNYPEPPMQEGTFRARALLSKEHVRKYDKLYLEAICQKLNGHTDVAHELLQHALEINPNASEALYEMALMQLQLNPKSDSILVTQGENMLQKAVQLEPSNRHYRSTLAERWIRTGKLARAKRLYEGLVAESPKTQEISVLARLYEALGEHANALRAIEKIESLEGADEQTALEKYNIYMQMGKQAEAYGIIEQMSEEHPDELRYRVLLGDLYMQNGYKEKALGIYQDILTTDPANKLVKMAMLQYYIGEGDTITFETNMSEIMLDAKIESEQKASLLQAYATEFLRTGKGMSKESIYTHFAEALSFPQYNNMLAELCIAFVQATKMPQESLRMPINAILRDEPENSQARLQMLSMLISDEDYNAITSLCHEGTMQDPENILFYYYEGIAYQQLDSIGAATNAFEKATAHIVENSDIEVASNIYAYLGDNYHSTGQNKKAFEAYEESLRLKKDNTLCLNNYAYFLCLEAQENIKSKYAEKRKAAAAQIDKACVLSKQVIEATPNEPTYLDTYAWTLYCKQQFTQAQIYIDQMLKNLPEEAHNDARSATLYDHAGDIYFRCRDTKKAIEFWTHAAQITDDASLKQKIEIKLKNKRL